MELLEDISNEWDYSYYLSAWDHLILPNFRHFTLVQRLQLAFRKKYVADPSFVEIRNASQNTARFPFPVELGTQLVSHPVDLGEVLINLTYLTRASQMSALLRS